MGVMGQNKELKDEKDRYGDIDYGNRKSKVRRYGCSSCFVKFDRKTKKIYQDESLSNIVVMSVVIVM